MCRGKSSGLDKNAGTADLLAELESVASILPEAENMKSFQRLPSLSQTSTLAAFDTLNNRYWISRAKRPDLVSESPRRDPKGEQVPRRSDSNTVRQMARQSTDLLSGKEQKFKVKSILEELNAYGIIDTVDGVPRHDQNDAAVQQMSESKRNLQQLTGRKSAASSFPFS